MYGTDTELTTREVTKSNWKINEIETPKYKRNIQYPDTDDPKQKQTA